MRAIRLKRRDWAIAVIGAFALAAVFLGYGAVSAAGDPPVAPASLKAERHDGYIEIIFTHSNEANIDGWQVQVRAGGTPWGDWYDLTDEDGEAVGPNRINGFIEDTDDDVRYRIRLRAVNEHGAGPYLKTVVAAVAPEPAPAPADLEAVAHGSDRIFLIWTSADDDAITGYQYNFRAKGDDWGGWTAASPTVTNESRYLTFDDLEADTIYRFKLRAMRGEVEGHIGRAKGTTEAVAESS